MSSDFFVYLCRVRILSKKIPVFIAILLWSAVSFQAVHLYAHTLENHAQDALHTHQHDNCYICDFTFSSYLLPNTVGFQPAIWELSKVIHVFTDKDYHQLPILYYSLRAPPVLA